jgi:hypothetical protein
MECRPKFILSWIPESRLPFSSIFVPQRPNIVVEWLTPLLRIREVLGSNVGPETGYPDWACSWFYSFSPGEWRPSILKWGHDLYIGNPFYFIIHLSPFHLRVYNLRYWKSVVKNTNTNSSPDICKYQKCVVVLFSLRGDLCKVFLLISIWFWPWRPGWVRVGFVADTGTGFSSSSSFLPCQCHSTMRHLINCS